MRLQQAISLAILLGACGSGGSGVVPGDAANDAAPDGAVPIDAVPIDGSPDAAPDAAVPIDASPDAAPVNEPFPADPAGGEFAWVISAAGMATPYQIAVDPADNILLFAAQTGEVTLGSVHLPAPSAGALVVLKLTRDGEAIWGRTLTGSPFSIGGASIASTSTGDVVVGGHFGNGNLQVGDRTLVNAGGDDGFVVMLDGADGTLRWANTLGTALNDGVGAVAVGSDAVYVQAGRSGDPFTNSVMLLIRYDLDGTQRWAMELPQVGFTTGRTLGLDVLRGPVFVGMDKVTGYMAVTGLDFEGGVRFTREIESRAPSETNNLAVAPDGEVYLGTSTTQPITIVDGHVLPRIGESEDLMVLRLSSEGRYAFSSQIPGRLARPDPLDMAVDPGGSSYMLARCEGTMEIQPEVTCLRGGAILVSRDADHRVRWSTFIKGAIAHRMAAASQERMILAGDSLGASDFAGVHVSLQRTFIAALSTRAARLPSPPPARPEISGVTLEGALDRQIREGGRGVLVIDGAGLDHVTSAQLGDIEVHVPAEGTASQLRLPVRVPHIHAPGALSLTLANAGGTAQIDDAVTVTPIVVGPDASPTGRGTFSSPIPLCGVTFGTAGFGDVVLLLDGVHTCFVQLNRGFTVRGQSTAGTIVRGSFVMYDGGFGPSAIERLTLETTDFVAIDDFLGGGLSVTDVVIADAPGTGIVVDSGGTLRVRGSRITARQHGLVVVHPLNAVDLGTAASPGDNQLTNTSGGPALEDRRTVTGAPIDAHGTTLNGATFTGEVQGPVTVPGAYSVAGPNLLRF